MLLLKKVFIKGKICVSECHSRLPRYNSGKFRCFISRFQGPDQNNCLCEPGSLKLDGGNNSEFGILHRYSCRWAGELIRIDGLDNSCFFLILQTVEPKADGSAYRWESVTKAKRQQLGVADVTLRPWTSRPNTLLNGLARQLVHPNFLEELLDIRFIDWCKRAEASLDSEAPLNLWTEIRQDLNYQVSGGSISMLSGSRIYNYRKDRCLCGMEHLRFNGWGADTVYEGITEPVWNTILVENTCEPPRPKRGKKGENDVALAEMAGNSQGLADLALFAIPLSYVLRRHIFENDADLEVLKTLFAPSADGPIVALDPNESQKTLRAMRSNIGSVGSAKRCADLSECD